MKTVRCAIYTRKSSEEGLEQAFNSLDAQREACAAYVLSQTSEGWVALPDIYDDGGLSGGTLERPAIQRLLAEVSAGRVDIIVVYKVDRLTRSLLDFSKLVEAFDKAGVSFVSVTQSFNTTTSMGRLTLNMLLSFAQFEREVTAERIRDKIAASKAKGMWMGGTPPLGYRPDGRSLAIVEEHAAIVRYIFNLYLKLGNVRLVTEHLGQHRVRSPIRFTSTGKTFGGTLFTRGQIYCLLKSPIYIGEIHHRGKAYPGLHTGIIERDVWDRTQQMLADNLQGHRHGTRAAKPSLLAGKLFDSAGQPLIATHACKPVQSGAEGGRVRYRYYISRDLNDGASATGMRIPAGEIEAAVTERLAALFSDGLLLAATAQLQVHPSAIRDLTERSTAVAARGGAMCDMVQRIRIFDGRIEIDLPTASIAAALGAEPHDDAPPTLTVQSDIRLTRSGRVMRLVQGNGALAAPVPSTALIKAVVRAHRWWGELKAGQLDVTAIGRREGVSAAYVTRIVRLAFLAPAATEAVLTGTLKADVDVATLTATDAVSPMWDVQRAALLPGR